MSDFVNTELKKVNWGHPDSAIRLASAVHRFPLPIIHDKISFQRSFETVGSHARTKSVVKIADATRKDLNEALSAKRPHPEQVIDKAEAYLSHIHQILFTCKMQPESARLDERLMFKWASGIEPEPSNKKKDNNTRIYESEALMYDMVMVISSMAIARSHAACDASGAGEFSSASREFSKAAGICEYMEKDALPKWISRGTVPEEGLPSEATIGVCKALRLLFLINAQQMAVSSVLIKPGVPNYGLLAKLCLAISEKYDEFVSIMRKEAFGQMTKMDNEFFTLVIFQVNFQKALCYYFNSRQLWDSQKYGLAIAMLSEATVALKTRYSITSVGIPALTGTKTLHTLQKDLEDLRLHMRDLLTHWEADNTAVYFDRVPPTVSDMDKLQIGLFISKVGAHTFTINEDIEPLPLILPDSALERSDSDLARQLQEQMNME